MFLDFLDSRGGTPRKRIPVGFIDKVCVLIFTPKYRVSSMFLDFLDSRGGTPYKHDPEGFFYKVCVLIFTP